MSPSTCRSCGARILWVRTATGKAMPLDALPRADGNVVVEGGQAVLLPRGEHRGGVKHYVSHFATCPQAAIHRKRTP